MLPTPVPVIKHSPSDKTILNVSSFQSVIITLKILFNLNWIFLTFDNSAKRHKLLITQIEIILGSKP